MDEDLQRSWLELNWRLEQARQKTYTERMTYLSEQCPNTFPARRAVIETLQVLGVLVVVLVLPIIGLTLLGGPILDLATWVWVAIAGVSAVFVFQWGRVYQAAKSRYLAMVSLSKNLDRAGWPALNEQQEAGHRDTKPERLMELAQSSDTWVLLALGENPNLPPAGLAILADHGDPSVRLRPAWAARTPRHVLEGLSNDSDEDVREAALKTLATAKNGNAS